MATVYSLITILGIVKCTICGRVNVELGRSGTATSNPLKLGRRLVKVVPEVDRVSCISLTKSKNVDAR